MMWGSEVLETLYPAVPGGRPLGEDSLLCSVPCSHSFHLEGWCLVSYGAVNIGGLGGFRRVGASETAA